MPMANQALAAIVRCEASMGRKKLGDLGLHRLRQQRTRAVAQRLCQRSGDVARLA
jgi:hypothetical protein